jgi:hypothetical protein
MNLLVSLMESVYLAVIAVTDAEIVKMVVMKVTVVSIKGFYCLCIIFTNKNILPCSEDCFGAMFYIGSWVYIMAHMSLICMK